RTGSEGETAVSPLYVHLDFETAVGEGLPMANPEGPTQCFDAFVVALSQACEGGEKRWYVSTLELQLTSLGMCRACRNVSTLRVRVEDQTPT
ncbi:unnamed protein product, partial [Ectocarpus sp. 6 AP-2014]